MLSSLIQKEELNSSYRPIYSICVCQFEGRGYEIQMCINCDFSVARNSRKSYFHSIFHLSRIRRTREYGYYPRTYLIKLFNKKKTSFICVDGAGQKNDKKKCVISQIRETMFTFRFKEISVIFYKKYVLGGPLAKGNPH